MGCPPGTPSTNTVLDLLKCLRLRAVRSAGLFLEDFLCAIDVLMDLSHQSLYRVETAFVPDTLDEMQPEIFSVNIAVESQ